MQVEHAAGRQGLPHGAASLTRTLILTLTLTLTRTRTRTRTLTRTRTQTLTRTKALTLPLPLNQARPCEAVTDWLIVSYVAEEYVRRPQLDYFLQQARRMRE